MRSPSILSSKQFLRAFVAGLGLSALAAAAPALADGGWDDSASAGKAAQAEDLTTCTKGQIWDGKAKTCGDIHAASVTDDRLADYAYALAKATRYDEALQTLDLMKNSNTAEALNYRGYATRKLGRTDEGIGYYQKAIALDPKYPQVREYLGEAYITKGQLDLARKELATIQTLCGSDCTSYRDLADAIAKAPTKASAK